LLANLNAAGIRYVVVAGIAVIGHGVIRATSNLVTMKREPGARSTSRTSPS